MDAFRETMRFGMTGGEVVVNNAGWYVPGISPSAPTCRHSINVKGTENVLCLTLEIGVSRTIYISTMERRSSVKQKHARKHVLLVCPHGDSNPGRSLERAAS